jgi:phosphate:Na+ symporter
LTADTAIARVDTLRSLQILAWHAWRSTAHLVGLQQHQVLSLEPNRSK